MSKPLRVIADAALAAERGELTEQAAWSVINEVVLDVNVAELSRRIAARQTVNVPLRSSSDLSSTRPGCTAHSLCEEAAG